jgi:hypothetical protein
MAERSPAAEPAAGQTGAAGTVAVSAGQPAWVARRGTALPPPQPAPLTAPLPHAPHGGPGQGCVRVLGWDPPNHWAAAAGAHVDRGSRRGSRRRIGPAAPGSDATAALLALWTPPKWALQHLPGPAAFQARAGSARPHHRRSMGVNGVLWRAAPLAVVQGALSQEYSL